jgi:hypothetical protein
VTRRKAFLVCKSSGTGIIAVNPADWTSIGGYLQENGLELAKVPGKRRRAILAVISKQGRADERVACRKT